MLADPPCRRPSLARELAQLDALILLEVSAFPARKHRERLSLSRALELARWSFQHVEYVGTGAFRHAFRVIIEGESYSLRLGHTLVSMAAFEYRNYRRAVQLHVGHYLATPYFLSSTVGLYEWLAPLPRAARAQLSGIRSVLDKTLDLNDLEDKAFGLLGNAPVALDYAEATKYSARGSAQAARIMDRYLRLG